MDGVDPPCVEQDSLCTCSLSRVDMRLKIQVSTPSAVVPRSYREGLTAMPMFRTLSNRTLSSGPILLSTSPSCIVSSSGIASSTLYSGTHSVQKKNIPQSQEKEKKSPYNTIPEYYSHPGSCRLPPPPNCPFQSNCSGLGQWKPNNTRSFLPCYSPSDTCDGQ